MEIDNQEETIELTPEEQAIADKVTGKEVEDNSVVELPSETAAEESKGDDAEELFAGKYQTLGDLLDGINNLNSELPKYVIDGMSDEALEQHYLELQKDFSKNGRKHTKQESEGTDEAKEEGSGKPEQVSKELWNELESYYSENGNITNEMYDKLNAAGIPDRVVDKYMDSLGADQQAFTDQVFEIAGGEEQYQVIKAWAEDGNIPAKQIEAISKMDYDGMLLSMQGIKAKYDAEVGSSEPATRITGGNKSNNSGSYGSQTEYILDISDKRYGNDKKYTYAVDTKFTNSKNLQ